MINYSPSCERNQQVILEHLQPYIPSSAKILEIGSYSGQHAIHFCHNQPDLTWQASDQFQYIQGLEQNFRLANLANLLDPIEINVAVAEHWPKTVFDVIYSANTLHIMSWQHVEKMFENISACIKANTLVCIYGPFKYNAQYTSSSNEQFQQWLLARDPLSGIRDFEAVQLLAEKAGLTLLKDINMPANNQLLIWQYKG
ncbi:DUF938 domain-containing protein [Thalassomonas sp. M1454]|nr:DUF938 domain-containing protein [Thalassomonas sp. M1454]